MFIHFHSLYLGLMVLVLLLFSRLPPVFGIVIIPLCLLVELGQFIDRLKSKHEPWLFAVTVLIQSVAIAYLFVRIRLSVFPN